MNRPDTSAQQAPQAEQAPQYPPPPPPVAYSPPPPQVSVPPVQPKTSGLAIASLVLGLLWMYGIGSVLAIVFAGVAKKNIRESNGWVTGNGMATAGLVLGIIGVIVLVAIIAAAATSNAVLVPGTARF